jgi:general secretion pathway protein F
VIGARDRDLPAEQHPRRARALSGAGFVAPRWFKTTAGPPLARRRLLKLPIVGGIFRRFAITQFTRSLGTLLGGGTPLVPALENARTRSATASVSRQVARSFRRCARGRAVEALEQTGIFTT